jgi:cellulose synthase/poly-beta-1,6-N-acetylglucosamine synthase-like glycosyltransferase
MQWLLITSMLFLPASLAMFDLFGGLRARHKKALELSGRSVDDFEVLVPIYGSLKYLENVDFLADYGRRVVLCTTSSESPEFECGLEILCRRYGFRVFRASVARPIRGAKRATSGTVRDQLVRDAHSMLAATWVVCIDADTVTDRPLGELVGAMAERGLDLASVRLVPSNSETLLARLQQHEYYRAMLLRRIMPWLVSGACHAARREAHARIMAQHSLFFQGNDVEVGLLGSAFGYQIGHIPVDVPTTVPSHFKPWIRQRLAWSGGEVRLFLANPQIAFRHPAFWGYGAIVAILLFPARWLALISPGWPLVGALAAYALMTLLLHRGHIDRYLLLLPFYAAFSSLILTPLGLLYYVKMALADRNLGLIRINRKTRQQMLGRHCGDRSLPMLVPHQPTGSVDLTSLEHGHHTVA